MVLVSALLCSWCPQAWPHGLTTAKATWPRRGRPGWITQPTNDTADNAFKVQWELFLRHVVKNEPFP